MEPTELMDVERTIDQARDAITVRRVFGEPYERDGVTVIPAARVQGGAGGGGGEGPVGQGKGSGMGFGLSARPVGAFLIRGDEVAWQPAVDLNRLVLGGQVVAIIALLTIRTIVKVRGKALMIRAMADARSKAARFPATRGIHHARKWSRP